jgi:PadR family transcriptional regulator, regulatory protein PadR
MNTENAIQQMRKGVLELCALAIIANHDEIYPADIQKALAAAGIDVVEGTLYPLLLRLKNAGHLTHKYVENQSAGPPRKYYKITEQGQAFLNELRQSWNEFTDTVDTLVNPNQPKVIKKTIRITSKGD